MTSFQYLHNFAPTLDNLKSFQWTRHEIQVFYSTLINCSTELF